jgi:hypothetical protein
VRGVEKGEGAGNLKKSFWIVGPNYGTRYLYIEKDAIAVVPVTVFEDCPLTCKGLKYSSRDICGFVLGLLSGQNSENGRE